MKENRQKSLSNFYQTFGLFIGAGTQIVILTLAGAWAGGLLDERMGSSPLMMMVLMFLGFGLGLYNMFRILELRKRFRERDQNDI